ncbi:MAG TPA: glyoxalase [Gammaproteobacteria bacterium]|nr:glyoxalase [Gammaproteobacteria bacterium]
MLPDELPGRHLDGHHHITMATLDPQEDFDFHTKVLGLKCVKRTLFYDGATPVYHLYYGNDLGEESTLLTTFPVAHIGVKGVKGSGQVSNVSLSVPTDAVDYWKDRLTTHALDVTETERFGERHLDFTSPHGIDLAIVGVDTDERAPRTNGPVPEDMMIRGTHAAGVLTRDLEFMEEFLQVAWGSHRVADEGNRVRYSTGGGGSGYYTDFTIEPDTKPGSWTVGAGAIHHMAYKVNTPDQQQKIKLFIEGLGYTDVSEPKDRGYFDSIYVRTPSGALFEACCSHNPSFLCNEPLETLGTTLMMSPQIESDKDEVLKVIGEIKDD